MAWEPVEDPVAVWVDPAAIGIGTATTAPRAVVDGSTEIAAVAADLRGIRDRFASVAAAAASEAIGTTGARPHRGLKRDRAPGLARIGKCNPNPLACENLKRNIECVTV